MIELLSLARIAPMCEYTPGMNPAPYRPSIRGMAVDVPARARAGVKGVLGVDDIQAPRHEQVAAAPLPSKPADPVRRWTLITLVLCIVLFGWTLVADRLTPYTSDASVRTFVVRIAPEVSGKVIEVAVRDNQIARTGDLLFRIAGKMFTIIALDRTPNSMAFKCTPENFAELTEREGIIPAPYLARNNWVMLESLDALPRAALKRLIRESYDLVAAKLSKKVRSELGLK